MHSTQLPKCEHPKKYVYYGGVYGYETCEKCDRWWRIDLEGDRQPVEQAQTKDVLSEFV